MQFLASKWLHIDFLISHEEMKRLFSSLQVEHETLFLFSTLGVQKRGQNRIKLADFFHAWKAYEEALQKNEPLNGTPFRFFFTNCISKYEDAVEPMLIGEDRERVMPKTPCLQMQPHRFSYSKLDGKFRSMVLGKNSVSWGVRVSYPQLYQIPNSREVVDALEKSHFPNAALFSSLRSWLRHNSLPTPMIVDGKRVNIPMRIGKECLPWINNHPELGALKVGL